MTGSRWEERPDLEITAAAKVRELRFEKVPETETRFRGEAEDTSSQSARENLPSRVREEETYHQASYRYQGSMRGPRATEEASGAEKESEENGKSKKV